jgi:hypothetical protein
MMEKPTVEPKFRPFANFEAFTVVMSQVEVF